MIRDRRPEDLDHLCSIVETLEYRSGIPVGKEAREWLEECEAEISWVYDMAPVTVTPTKNVVGHLQVYNPVSDPSTPSLAANACESDDDLLAIGRLFVKPSTYEKGIARHLLKESTKYIQLQGGRAVLDIHSNGILSRELVETLGFKGVSSTPDAAPRIYIT